MDHLLTILRRQLQHIDPDNPALSIIYFSSGEEVDAYVRAIKDIQGIE